MNLNVLKARGLFAAFALSLVPALGHAASVSSTFDSGLEGWTLAGGTASFLATGGNPDGHLNAVDGIGTQMTLTASSAYTGLALLDGGTLSFDFIEKINPDGNFASAGFVTLNGASGMQAQLDLITGDPGLVWETYSVSLTAAAWGETQNDWENIIGNIASITVNVESGSRITETIGFDNFSVDVVAPVSLPATLPFLAAGLALFGALGWRRRSA